MSRFVFVDAIAVRESAHCLLRLPAILQLENHRLADRPEPPRFGLGPRISSANSLSSPVDASLMLTGVRAGVRLGRFPNCVVHAPIFELAVNSPSGSQRRRPGGPLLAGLRHGG